MVEVIIIAEGQTEERFIKQLIAPAVRQLQIYVKPLLMNTSQKAKGGAVSFDRLKFNVRNVLRREETIFLSTFLDLYALDSGFPSFNEAKQKTDVYTRVQHLERSLKHAIVEHIGCRPDRFLPHIQPYEFEGLLFSDIEALCSIEPSWTSGLRDLQAVRASVDTPEHINDGYETKPSKRLEKTLLPRYQKTTHGPRAAERITLSVIERECSHFRAWMDSLRRLAVYH